MQKRNKWIYKTENGVKVYSPTSDSGKGRYYRVVYPYNGRFRDTTATTEDLAIAEAVRISLKIKSRGDLRSELPVTYFLDAYLDSSIRTDSGNFWGPKHTLAQEGLMNLYVRPKIGHIPCTKITNELWKEIVKAGRTFSNAQHLRSAIEAWIRWGKSARMLGAELSNTKYAPIIDGKYRWSQWAVSNPQPCALTPLNTRSTTSLARSITSFKVTTSSVKS